MKLTRFQRKKNLAEHLIRIHAVMWFLTVVSFVFTIYLSLAGLDKYVLLSAGFFLISYGFCYVINSYDAFNNGIVIARFDYVIEGKWAKYLNYILGLVGLIMITLGFFCIFKL